MSEWADLDGEMPIMLLDDNTAERMLSGAIAPPDAPPGYAPIAALFTHLAATPPPDPMRDGAAVLVISDMIRDAVAPVRRGERRLAVTIAVTAALAISFSGLAYAHGLPQPVRHATDTVLRALGISHRTSVRPRHSVPPGASPRSAPTLPMNATPHPRAAATATTHARTSSRRTTARRSETTPKPNPPATNPPDSHPAPAEPVPRGRTGSPGRPINRPEHGPAVSSPRANRRGQPASPSRGAASSSMSSSRRYGW